MGDGVTKQIQVYLDTVIPKIERELGDKTKSQKELLELYNLYETLLQMCAPHDFITFNKYLEFDDDHSDPNRAFYHHRKDHLTELFEAMNDMEVHDKYDMLLVMMPPRVGKSVTGTRFLAWIIGRYPEHTQLATSYSDNITTSFYNGAMEIILGERYKSVFPDAPLMNQNAKRQEIWLKVLKRYPSIVFVPINGSMTGRSEASKYLYCDDLVSGIEEALSVTRLDSLWQKYTINAKQRKKDGCKEIHIATPWSVHDPITKLSFENKDNPRCKIIRYPCYDEFGESQFEFKGGFSTKYYKELESTMDAPSFSALYLQEPIERDGLLYQRDEMKYYFNLPEGQPDSIVAVCDSKNLGKDHVALPVAYIFGKDVYFVDAVYNNGLPDVTKELVANKLVEHKVVRADVELNNGGNYYAEDVDELIKKKGGKTSIRLFFSANNKRVKIITYSDFVKKHFIFRDPSTYHPNSEYAKYVNDVFKWTQTGNNKFDDAPDSLAMLAQLIQELDGSSIKFLDRKTLGL